MKRFLTCTAAAALLAAPATAQTYCVLCTDEERLEHRMQKLEERQKAFEWCAKQAPPLLPWG